MRQKIRRSVKVFLNSLGYELRKIRGSCFPFDPFEAQRKIINDLGKNKVTILDVGAHKGQTAEVYRSKFPSAEIYCFEPYPKSVTALLTKFVTDARIHIVPKAVAKGSCQRTFYVNELDATNSLLPRPATDRRYYPQGAGPKMTIEVEVTSLDEFVTSNEISKVDILKFDIQGGELLALQGAKTLLQTGDISLIYTEAMFIPHYEGGPLFHELWKYIANFGFSLFQIYNICTAMDGQIRYGDALFVSDSIRKNVINKYPEEP